MAASGMPQSFYDPSRSLAENAGDPRALEQATNVALSAGPGVIKAFHGSPYDFSKFDLSQVGTGEGAQVHGHGLYFTEHEGVARDYRDNIRDDKLRDRIRHRQTEIVRERDKIKESGALFNKESPEIQRYEKLEEEYSRLAERRHALGHMYEVNINAGHEK
jgi:hypothetical protein